MANLVIPMGIPGCGKSTFAKLFYEYKYATISPDVIRAQVYGSLRAAHQVEGSNAVVFKKAHTLAERCLQRNVDVYFDATNLSRRSRDTLRELANGSCVIGILFSNVEEALKRNRERDDDLIVPDNVMDAMCSRYLTTVNEIQHESFSSLITISSVS